MLTDLLQGCVLAPSYLPGLMKLEMVPRQDFMLQLSRHPGVQYVTHKERQKQGWYVPMSLVEMGRWPGTIDAVVPSKTSRAAPSGLVLKPYQNATVSFLRWVNREREGAILAADMGLGKTASTLQALWETGYATRSVLICGPMLGRAAWCGPDSDPWKHYGIDVTQLEGVKDADTNILKKGGWFFIHYDILEAWHAWISAVLQPEAIIFDEIHLLCNPRTGRHKSAYSMSLSKSVSVRYGLTGTPIPNERIDLWGSLKIVQPRQWGHRWDQFAMRYAGGQRAEAHEGGGWVFTEDTNTFELRQRLAGTFLRYTKHDVETLLPPMERHGIQVTDPDPDVMDKYWQAERDIKGYLKSLGDPAASATSMTFGGQLVKLSPYHRQSGNWRIIAMTTMMGLLSEAKRAHALAAVWDVLSRHDIAVVFTQRIEAAKQLAKQLSAAPVNVYGPVYGGTKQAKRRELAQQFAAHKGDGTKTVFIATIGSAGICINELCAASAALFVDLWWRPCDLLQAEARVHREGQTASKVDIYYLTIPGTLDDHILELLDEKSQAASNVSPNDMAGVNLSADLGASSTTGGEPDLDAICEMLTPLLGGEA